MEGTATSGNTDKKQRQHKLFNALKMMVSLKFHKRHAAQMIVCFLLTSIRDIFIDKEQKTNVYNDNGDHRTATIF